MLQTHRVVIIGGGFGGLYAALSLREAPCEVTLVDRMNHHLFQPLLYQVATGGLSPADIASPLRFVLRRQKNTRVLLAEAIDIDVEGRRVILHDGEQPYDSLIVAAGSRHHYFGNDRWEELAPGLKSIEDATRIRARILLAYERAEREADAARRRALLTFVVAGGGPTGVELAGAIADLARDTLRNDFRRIDPRESRILLLEAGERLLPTFPPPLSGKARRALEKLGVTIQTGCMVAGIRPGAVQVKRGGGEEEIAASTVLWAAGNIASPLGRILERRAGARIDRAGRVLVEPDLSLAGHPEIFVIGDLAAYTHQTGRPLPAIAPVAMQEGRHAAGIIRRRLLGEIAGQGPPFRYLDKGSLATIGRSRAVAEIWNLRFSGFPAWLLWLLVHITYLIEFENKLLVLIQWAWSYFTRNRSARLITGDPPRG